MRPSPTRAARGVVGSVLGGVVLLLLSVVLPVVVAADASAHDALVGSTPASGAILTDAPDEVRLTFAEPPGTAGLGVAVTAPDGSSVVAGAPTVEANDVVAALVPLTRDGTYTVAWRVVSDDGHPVTGEFTFALSSGTSEASASAAPVAASAPASAGPGGSSSAGALVGVVVALLVGSLAALVVARRRRP